MHALRRITCATPVQTHTVHYQIQRHFSNPKAIPQISRRPVPYHQVTNKQHNIPAVTPSSASSKHTNRADILRQDIDIEDEEDEDDEYDADHVDIVEPECSLTNPYYSRLLDSKLDSCPPQPYNATTNIIVGALYDTLERQHNIEQMSRWEQIQRGYVRPESVTQIRYKHRKYSSTTTTTRRTSAFESSTHSTSTSFSSQWIDTIIDVNDILQSHDSLDDCVRNEKASSTSITLAKATGALNKYLDGKASTSDNTAEMEEEDETECGKQEGLEMRNDLKWKRRKMKLHIKKKRRDRLRMKKKTMQQRNQKQNP
mmetsp:Transcript_66560/g.105780  ORF Transcript_66560/g.105780 Transcript_66560/m.105780 type:complete len:313 (-) Transcript_66560:217-1155(-)